MVEGVLELKIYVCDVKQRHSELWNLFIFLHYINDHMYRFNNASRPRGECETLTVILECVYHHAIMPLWLCDTHLKSGIVSS